MENQYHQFYGLVGCSNSMRKEHVSMYGIILLKSCHHVLFSLCSSIQFDQKTSSTVFLSCFQKVTLQPRVHFLFLLGHAIRSGKSDEPLDETSIYVILIYQSRPNLRACFLSFIHRPQMLFIAFCIQTENDDS